MPRSSDGMSEMRRLTTWAVSCSHCFFIEEIALDSSCVLKYRLKRGSVVSACAKSVCVTLVKRNDGGIFIMKGISEAPDTNCWATSESRWNALSWGRVEWARDSEEKALKARVDKVDNSARWIAGSIISSISKKVAEKFWCVCPVSFENAALRTYSRSYCAPVSLRRAVLGMLTYFIYAPLPALRPPWLTGARHRS